MPTRIELMNEGANLAGACWCFGQGDDGAASFIVKMQNGAAIPLQAINMTGDGIELIVDPVQSAKSAADILVETYLRRVISSSGQASKSDHIYLKATCDVATTVIAQVGMQRAQYLTAAYKRFVF
jgi:hypothetical protein